MQILWRIEQGTVQAIREEFDDEKPARTTVATVLNILEVKGFAAHRSEGRSNIYYALISKSEYSKSQLSGIVKRYFDNSFASMMSFFAKENNISIAELDELMREAKEELSKEDKK